MNRINQLFREKKNNILSIYFTAGHPEIKSAPLIIRALEKAGADMVEIGMPFSDPMADGPVIQNSSSTALKNGMSLKLLFEQLREIRENVRIPLLLMGYLNPVLQYGMERFCDDCKLAGIDGVILPDLPLEVYLEQYQRLFEKNELHKVFLISPETKASRVAEIDAISRGFLYFVSSSATTGARDGFSEAQIAYFERIRTMNTKNPALVGFGISDHKGFTEVCKYAAGAIVGSAFVRMLSESKNYGADIVSFISLIKAGRE